MRERSTRSRALDRRESGVVADEGIVVPYHVVRSTRRRRTLELRLEADGVQVAVPQYTSRHEIEAFVRSKIGWIRRRRDESPTPTAPARFVTGESLPYLGRALPLECVEGTGKRVQVAMDLLGVRVRTPRLTETERRDRVIEALRAWYRERAAEEVPQRVAVWTRRAGYEPSRVLIRDQKRRWGSCSKDRTLRFNWRLVMLAPAIIDYVIVHEIAHLVRPHHRASFWSEVERLLPDYRERRAALAAAGATLPL